MKRKILATLLSLLTLFTCIINGAACKDSEVNKNNASVKLEHTAFGGGMQIGESNDGGIRLTSAALLSSEYDEYGISPLAESAYTLTATVMPSGAANHGVDWEIAWSDATSTWAIGKTVTDYITVTFNVLDGKIATVSCMQPFGTQVIITAVSQDNPNATASCTVDYAQKVTGVNLYFGNVPINLGGETYVKYEVSPNANGVGGEIYADIETGSVYTISETFTQSVDLNYIGAGEESVFFTLKTGHPTGMDFMNRNEITNWYGEEVYFDYDHDICNWFIMTRSGDIMFDELTTAEIIEEFEGVKESTMYEITFMITGKYSTNSYASTMKCNGYTNATPVNALALDYTNYVF